MTSRVQKITVAGMLVHEEKALIVRRSKQESFMPGYYELPGGKVDFGEEPHESLVREFMEEVHLKVNVDHPLRVFHYVTNEGMTQTVEIVFLVHLDGDKDNLLLSEAHDEYEWINQNEIENIKLSDEIRKNLEAGFKLISLSM